MISDSIEYCIRTPDASDTLRSNSIIPQQDPDLSSQQHNAERCPSCGSDRLNTVQMPSGCKHYAAIRCGQCDRFLRWVPKPESQQKRQRQQTIISQLLKSSQLSQWERMFLEGLKGKKISPKQQEVLTRIEAKLGGQQ